MKVDFNLGNLDSLINEKFQNALSGKVDEGNSDIEKVREFSNMFKKMVGKDDKVIKLSADDLNEKFNFKNKLLNETEGKRKNDLAIFIKEEIEKQKDNKVDVLTDVEITKFFQISSVNENILLDNLKKIDATEEILDKVGGILNERNASGVTELINMLNDNIYNNEAVKKEYDGKDEFGDKVKNELDKLFDFYQGKTDEKNDRDKENYLNMYIEKLNLKDAIEELNEKKN